MSVPEFIQRSCQDEELYVLRILILSVWEINFYSRLLKTEVSKINLFLHVFVANIYKWDYIREVQTTVVSAMSVKRKRVESK